MPKSKIRNKEIEKKRNILRNNVSRRNKYNVSKDFFQDNAMQRGFKSKKNDN